MSTAIKVHKDLLPGYGFDTHTNEQKGKFLKPISQLRILALQLAPGEGDLTQDQGQRIKAEATIIKNHTEFSRQTGIGVSAALKCSLGMVANVEAEASLAMDWSATGSTDSVLVSLSCEVRPSFTITRGNWRANESGTALCSI